MPPHNFSKFDAYRDAGLVIRRFHEVGYGSSERILSRAAAAGESLLRLGLDRAERFGIGLCSVSGGVNSSATAPLLGP
jgi:hypothetical protein